MLAPANIGELSSSLESCYTAHHAKVFHLGLRYGKGNVAWAEDLTHDVFIKYAEHCERLHTNDDLGGWIYRVASNLAISRLRKEKSFFGRVTSMLQAEGSKNAPGVDVVFEDKEMAKQAIEALGSLPPKEQVALSMKILDDRSQSEIANVLGHSEGYVSKLIQKALSRLKAQGWEVPLS